MTTTTETTVVEYEYDGYGERVVRMTTTTTFTDEETDGDD